MSGIASRRAALEVLEQVRAGRPFGAALDQAVTGLAETDRRLAHELAAGVLRSQSTLDARLAPVLVRDHYSRPNFIGTPGNTCELQRGPKRSMSYGRFALGS